MTFESHNVKIRWASHLIRSRLETYVSDHDKDKTWTEAASAYWPTLMSRTPSDRASGLSKGEEQVIQRIVSNARQESGLSAFDHSMPQPRRRRR